MIKKIFTIVLTLALTIVSVFTLASCNKQTEETTPPAPDLTFSTFVETINGTEWTVTYSVLTRKIKTISSNYSETERYSKHYFLLKDKYGSDVYVRHIFTLSGAPCVGDSWFSIETNEIIIHGWYEDKILENTTKRHEEKFIFTIPQN